MDKIANLTEAQFNTLINQVIGIYAPLASSHGGNLRGVPNWKDSTVNAYAEQNGSDWTVQMFGGLARRAEVSPDGFSLVICHEVGHHLGGFPYYDAQSGDWAAVEGQADYFATQACAHALWGNAKTENAAFRANVPVSAKAKCDRSWSKTEDQDLCYRSTLAGQSLANLLAAITYLPVPSLTTPDTHKVARTNANHPVAQCRLDTYFRGSLCTTPFDSQVIPARNHPSGQDSAEAEQDAAKVSCDGPTSSDLGTRPACWFKSQLN